MSVVALTSAKHSPGVTVATLALASLWPRRVLVAECDPAGGDILAGYLRAEAEPRGGLLTAALAARRGPVCGQLGRHTTALSSDGRVGLLSGLADPSKGWALQEAWPALVDAFHQLATAEPPTDVLADCGRLGAIGTPVQLLTRADVVLLVTRTATVDLARARPRLQAMREELPSPPVGPGLALLLVGGSAGSAREVSAALGAPVVATLAEDSEGAAVFAFGEPPRRGFAVGPLVRSAQQAVEQLQRLLARRAMAGAVSATTEPMAVVPAVPASDGAR